MKHALITGAAAGIGRALALALAERGYSILGVDVDAANASATQAELHARGHQAHFIQADLSQPDFLSDVLPHVPPLSVLVNNAGISAVGAFETLDWSLQQRVLAVNLRAPIQLTTALTQRQALEPHGVVVFVSSLAHYVGYPGAAVYAASKDGVAAYARNLRLAWRHTGPQVLVVFPGPTRTAHAHRYSPNNAHAQRRMPPETLAAHMVRAIERRQSTLFPGASAWLMSRLGLWWPGLAEQVMKRTLFDALRGRTLT